MIRDLRHTKIMSFEIGTSCNLASEHGKCPINKRIHKKEYGVLTTQRICEVISEAKQLNFHGHIAFHYYNEPLLYIDRIKEVIEQNPSEKFLLWTNGLLLERVIEKNDILKQFDMVVITCYEEENYSFFEQLKEYYKNIKIATWQLDDRLLIYDSPETNEIGCKRILFDLPIDYYGNIHLCCEDWNNTYEIGNVNEKSLVEIVNGDIYQRLLQLTKNRLLDWENCPPVCKRCREPFIKINYEV